jgi:hypothetical protein
MKIAYTLWSIPIAIFITSCMNTDIDILHESDWYQTNNAIIQQWQCIINDHPDTIYPNWVIWVGEIQEIVYNKNTFTKERGYIVLKPADAVSYLRNPQINVIKLWIYQPLFNSEIPQKGETWAFLSIASKNDEDWFVYKGININKINTNQADSPNGLQP